MGGFIGIIKHQQKEISEEDKALFKQQNDQIRHRGPNVEEYYFDEYVSFGFRGASENENQPVSYDDEKYWIVFNGKIYNHIELKNELVEDGYTFESETDSEAEVILAMFKKDREEAFKQLRGMFALLIWDKEEKTLYGARDHFGIKPLFYSQQEEGIYFASEKKSIGILLDKEEVDETSLHHYLSFQFVPDPMTLTKGIEKVAPGHYFYMKPGEDPTFVRYFHAQFNPSQSDKTKVMEDIRNVLYDSVEKQMRHELSIGSFLSGGIDSTIIVAIAKELKPDLKTFSVGFEREGFSEIDVAKESADKLGVENISYVITPEEYVQKLPLIMWHNDDPLADPSCVPLYFLGREASKYVDVALSGEGSDELFGGYNIYREPDSLKVFDSIPKPAKDLLHRVSKVMPEGVRGKSFIERGTTPLSERYIGNAKMFEEDEKKELLLHYNEAISYHDITKPLFEQVKDAHPVHQMQYIDIHTWMRGDILLKADRMTMAHGLEVRMPFLDIEVMKIASEIPVEYKIANNTTKSILREAMASIIPEHVLNRKKLGFPVPIRHWLRDELYDWAKNLIKSSDTDHLLHKSVIFELLDKHKEGKHDYSRKIWTVLMFMLWHQIYVERIFDIEALKEQGEIKSKLTTPSES